MHAHDDRCRRVSHRRREGFTIIELMIVVAITGILAAIAIPTFSGYVHKSRAAEATSFLGEIKLAQETYRSEFGQYANHASSFPPGSGDWVPGSGVSGGNSQAWPANPDFAQLGARPDGPVRFQYTFAGGAPGSGPTELGFDTNTQDFWFAATAQADLDGDSVLCTYEITSHTNRFWYTPAKGWE